MEGLNKYIQSNQLFEKGKHKWQKTQDDLDIIILADQLRTPENMGAIIRLADNLQASKVLFINDDPSFNIKENKVKKASGSSHHHSNYLFITSKEIEEHIPADYQKIAIETTSSAKCIYETSFPKKCAFFVGNERYGIRQELLNDIEQAVYIPIPGNTKSLNVSHSLSIALFEWFRQMNFK
ncbi:MAG: TrmH family RNA methyltransferase [Bacteroidales bacterium]